MDYIPRYAKGKILVDFIEGDSDFARTFGRMVGYDFIEKYQYRKECSYVFRTEPGQENFAINKFRSFSDFISDAELIDEKFHERSNNLRKVKEMVQDLDDDVELPDDIYQKKLEEIVNQVTEIK